MAETATQPQPEQPQGKLTDQSFVTYEGDLALLEYIEKRFAKYANGLTQTLGVYEVASDTNTDAGQQSPGFFRHGVVDAIQNSFVPKSGSGPIDGERFS